MNRKRAIILISVFSVVVIANVIILYLIINPVYRVSQTAVNSEIARAAIADIFSESIIYQDTNDKWPNEINELSSLDLTDRMMNDWDYSILSDSTKCVIIAISTDSMMEGAGKVIEFNCDSGTWSGYGSN